MTHSDVLAWIDRHRGDLRTPLYLYSEDALASAATALRGLLPTGSEIFYSLKANPQPAVAARLHACGARPEIASEGEWYMCEVGGIPPRDVLVGGVSKSRDYLARVCRAGCFAITIDSRPEWERLKSLPADLAPVRILTRVSPGIALGGLDMGGESQFGLSIDDAVAIANECAATRHEFLGIHLYLGSQRLKPEPIAATVKIAVDTLREFAARGVRVQVADVGLGHGVPYLERDIELDRGATSKQLQALWSDPVWRTTRLWSEAGRSLAAASGYYIVRVVETKQLHGKTFVFVDGGLQAHNPGLGLGKVFRSNPRFLFPGNDREPAGAIEIVGNLCTSADRIGSAVKAPPLAPGDLVVIPNAGAYNQTTGMWGFNSQRPFEEAMLDAQGHLRYVEPQYLPLFRAYAGSGVPGPRAP